MDIENRPPGFPWIKVIIVIVVILVLYWLARPYINKMLAMIETIRKLLNTAIEFSSSLSKNIVDETSVGSKLVVNKLSKKKQKPPSPDDTTSSVQTKGYCYVGEWEGVRSCVRVDKTPCEDKVYSTKQACVNPELR